MLENFDQTQIPFYAVYILESNSGVELVSHSFSPSRADLDINAVSGMFKALELFINSMAYSNQYEMVQEINFQGMRIVYERYGPMHHQILCVGLSNKAVSASKEHQILKAIVRDFYETYRPALENFQGNVKNFDSFIHTLRAIPQYFQNIIPYYKPYQIISKTSKVAGSELPKHYDAPPSFS